MDNSSKDMKVIWVAVALSLILAFVAIYGINVSNRSIKTEAQVLKLAAESRSQSGQLLLAEREGMRMDLASRAMASEIISLEQVIQDGIAFKWPAPEYVFQRGVDGNGTIHYQLRVTESLRGKTLKIELKDAVGRIVASSNKLAGNFSGLGAGEYQLKANSGGKAVVCDVAIGDIFLIAGQSNAVSSALDHPPMASDSGMVRLTRYKDRAHWSRVFVPDAENPAKKSLCWLYFGDRYAKAAGVPVMIINIARGGTSTRVWSRSRGYLHFGIKEVLKETRVRAILWHQGEADEIQQIDADESFANMMETVAYSRELQNDVVWFVAVNSATGHGEAIRSAQERLIGQEGIQRGPDTDKIRAVPEYVDEQKLHFKGEGLEHHGGAWFVAVSDILLKG